MKTNIKKSSLSDITSLGRVRLLAFLSACALFFSIASALLLNTDLIKDWENRFQAQYYLWRWHFTEPEASPLPMVIVLIDDHSLPANSARSPIDRAWLADLMDVITKRHPTLVAMNILLDRPGKDLEDRKLKEAISRAGNVILRTDPIYPVYPDFAKAALDKGTLKFRLDSSDTVQEVCANKLSCQSPHIFFKKILDYYQVTNSSKIIGTPPDLAWLKINFTLGTQEHDQVEVRHVPVIRAHEIALLPDNAFHGKIVLLGTGFPDLYPLYRVPLSEPGLMLQETEIIAQVLSMIAGKNYLTSPGILWIAVSIYILMLGIAFMLVYRGMISGMASSLATIIVTYITAGLVFAFLNIELPFVLPASLIFLFTITGIVICSVQERLFRLTAELNLKQAKIDFLTNELHSHHLFNEFSRLSVMIQHNPKAAKEYLVEFAEMLRCSLKYGDKAMVPVGIQLEYLESYLKQQQMVYEDKLTFTFSKADQIESYSAPWHTFYPLVENAVKYSESLIKQTSQDRVTILIDLSIVENKLVFAVTNPFDATLQTVSSKTGLKNLQDRLVLAYPEGGFDLSYTHDEHTWRAELTLPIQKGTV